MEMNWYMVYTKPEAEKKVLDHLSRKQFEFYLPLSKSAVGKRVIQQPLLKSHLFVRTCTDLLPSIKSIPGVRSLVYWLNKPVIVPDAEIEYVRQFLKDRINVKVEKIQISNAALSGINTQNGIEPDCINNTNFESLSLMLPSLGFVINAEYKLQPVHITAAESFQQKIKSTSYRYFLSEWLARG